MAKPVKRGSSYRLRVYAYTDSEGRKVYKSFTGKTPAECRAQHKQWLKEGGAIYVPPKTGPEEMTLGEAIETYITRCASNKTRPYSPATLKAYRSNQKSFEMFAHLPCKNITIDDIQDYVDQRAAEGVCMKTIKNDVYLLKPALKLAKRSDLDYTALELPLQDDKEYIIPTDDQVRALLDHFDDDDEMAVAVAMGAFLGLRRSELAAVTWGDVDRERMILKVTKAIVMGCDATYVQKATKTKAGKRDIYLSEDILDILRRRAVTDGKMYEPKQRLITISPMAVSNRFRRACAALGFQFSFHGLRHYHASVMLALDVPQAYIVSDMGHSDFSMVQKVYGQMIADKQRKVAAQVHAHAASVIAGEKYAW